MTGHGVLLQPICQEELYDPGRDVSINPNKNSILTSWRPVPDVRLGYTSTGQSKGRLAGHSNPQTTQIYDRRRRRVTRNIVERISV